MVNVALIGCGTMGRTHANSYKNINNANLIGVCDINMEKAQSIAKISGSHVYLKFEEMLENENIDVVDICIPTYMHKEYALTSMEARKHVFCEKPIALTLKDANEMVRFSEKMSVKFTVGHVVRYFPAYKRAVDAVGQGEIGIPKLIRTTRNQGFPKWSWEGWYMDYEKSGGPILDLIIHDFDWINYYFGDVERVYAQSLNGKAKEQDHCVATLRLKNGAIAHVEGSWAYPEGSVFRTTFEVVGTNGQIEFDSLKSCGIEKQINNGHHITSYLSPTAHSMEPYQAELREFINCVEADTKVSVSGSEAVKALQVALAAIESSLTGRPVTLKNYIH